MTTPNDETRQILTLAPGTVVGRYEIRERLGAGGMGEVFLAWDPSLKRTVAVKFPPPHLAADASYRDRLIREAQAMAGIDHPNIVHVYDVGSHQEHTYVVMEHVVGETLHSMLERGAVSSSAAARFGRQLAEALAQAHNKGVLHRDVKPNNIMIDAHGRAKLFDFGLATLPTGEPLTQAGSTLGTVGYMAPEVVKGEDAAPASDLFSLGVVLFQCLTGERPFSGSNQAAVLNAVLNEKPAWPQGLDIHHDLKTLCEGLLAKNPQDRPQTAAEAAASLNTWASETTLHAPVSTSKSSMWKWGAAILAAAVLFVLGIRFLAPEPPGVSVAEGTTPKLVVMPFENLAGGDRTDPMGEVMSSLIITELSEAKTVSVMSNAYVSEVINRLGGTKDALSAADEMHAQLVISGKILQQEPKLVITAQLIKAEDGSVIGAERVQGEEGDTVFDVVDNLAALLRSELGIAAPDSDHGSIAAVTTSSPEAYAEYVRGFKAGEAFLFADAIGHLRRAVTLDEEFASAWMELSRCYFGIRDRDAADSCAAKAKQYAHKTSARERLFLEAFVADVSDDSAGFVSTAKKITSRYPQDPYSWMEEGYAHMEIPDRAEAARCFKQAVALDSNFAPAHNQLAYIYEALGEFEKSIESINQYIRIKPDEPNPYDTRGDLYAFSGQLEPAAESYKKALEKNEEFWPATLNLARVRVFQARYKEAEELFQKGIAGSTPRMKGAALFGYVSIPAEQGKFREALQRVDQSLASAELTGSVPFIDDFWLNKGAVYAHIYGDYGTALAMADTARAVNPEGWGWEDGAYYLYALGKKKEAYARLEQSQNTDRAFAANFYRAMILMLDERYEEAAKEFEKHRGQWDYFYRYSAGLSYLEAGDLSKATEVLLETANRFSPSRLLTPGWGVLVHYQLGRAYQASGWPDKAAEQFEIFLERWKNADPGLVQVDDAQERLKALRGSS